MRHTHALCRWKRRAHVIAKSFLHALVWRLIWREFRAQSSRLIFYAACLAVGVAAVAAVSGFSEQVQETVRRNSRLLLGGDVELRDVRQLPPSLVERVRALPEVERSTRLNAALAMAQGPEGQAKLVDVQAVEEGFPLVAGGFSTEPPGLLDNPAALAGKIVVDSALYSAWKLAPGERVTLAGVPLEVAGVLTDELARDLSSLALGPRIYTTRTDAQRAGLIERTSRFRERLLVTLRPGTPLDAFTTALTAMAKEEGVPNARISDHEKGAGQGTRPLRNLGFFLSQIALSTLVLTGLGAASGLGEHLRSRLPHVALYRALGARPVLPTQVLLGVTALVAVCGVGAGLLLGTLVRHFVLVPLVGGYLPLALAPAESGGLTASLDVALASAVSLVLLCVPVLLSLQAKSPADVLRGDFGLARARGFAIALTGFVALALLAALFVRHAPSPRVGLILFGTTLGLFVLFRLVAALLISLFSRNETRLPLTLRLSLAEIAARRETVVLSLALSGLSLFLVCLVQFLKNDMLAPLEGAAAGAKPNTYLIDVQPSQFDAVLALARSHASPDAQVFSADMVRARLALVDGKTADPEADEDSRRFRDREQNITTREILGEGESIVESTDKPREGGFLWNQKDAQGKEISLEKDFARRIGAKLGSVLAFDVAGTRIEGRVTSLRSVTWQNGRPNFFIVAQPALFTGAPRQHFLAASVATEDQRSALTREVTSQFANVSVIDASAVVKRVAELATGVAAAVRFLASLLLAAAFLVLVAGLVATRGARMKHYAIVRALGARDGILVASLALEFLWLGGTSGVLGVAAAAILSRVFATTFLELDASLSAGPALALLGGSVAVTLIVGVASCAGVLRRKPAEVLRGGD